MLQQCPTTDWRLIFGLARFGGLRCPSEVLSLCWKDVLWDRDRFIVRSSKTEHHAGKDMRFVPLWPELHRLLSQAFELADPGAVHVVSKTRDSESNLGTQMARIIEHAGLKPWPKLFQNLRATRATEVANEYGEAKEAAWIGHSRRIARKHYLQITDDDYRAAARAAYALQNLHASGRTGSPAEQEMREKPLFATGCDAVPTGEWVYQDSNLGPQPYQGCALTN